MKKSRSFHASCLILCSLVFFAASGMLGNAAESLEQRDQFFQVSTLQALIAGEYDGSVSIGDLLQHGDTGLGTFDKLDGEMIVWEGIVYKACIDGKVYKVLESETTPFANVANFSEKKSEKIIFAAGYDSLKEKIDTLLPEGNMPVMLVIQGTFTDLVYRSVPAQEKPYPPLTEVVKKQAVFELAETTGILVGFRFPEYMKGINISGYHLHFLSSDKKLGGHLFKVGGGDCSVEGSYLNSVNVLLPDSLKDLKNGMSTDAEAVNKVEALNK